MAFGLLVAGCGGGGGDSADAQQIDKATFAKRANKICEQATGKLAAEVGFLSNREAAKPGYDYTKAQIVIAKEALIPRLEEELQEIQALGIPAEARKDVKAFFAASQRVIDWLKAQPRALIEGQRPPYAAAELTGTKFGVTECPFASS